MNKNKFKKIYFISLFQLLIQIGVFVWGLCFQSNANENVMSANFLDIITKVQTTNPIQNFLFCFINNLVLSFILFWVNYWTFGTIGTIWSVNNCFILGSMVQLAFIVNSWLIVCFVSIEFIAIIITTILSAYFRFEKFKIKKFFKKARIKVDDEIYKDTKTKQEKKILISLALIALVLLIAAILETIALSLIK